MHWRSGGRKAILILAAAMAGAGAGCRAQTEPAPPPTRVLDAWVASDMAVLTQHSPRRDDPLIYRSATQTVELFAGAHETVGFQVVASAQGGAAKGVGLEWTDLQCRTGSRIPAGAVRAWRMVPARATDVPAWTLLHSPEPPDSLGGYDALVPLDAPGAPQPYGLQDGQRVAFWVDIAVPRTATPGDYEGRLRLTAGSARAWEVTLRLRVYDFVLPDTPPFPVLGAFDHRELFAAMLVRGGQPFVPVRLDPADPLVRRGLDIQRHLMRTAREHRVDLFDTGVRPLLKRDRTGTVRLDWSDYDHAVSPYLRGTAFEDQLPVPAWPSPVTSAWPDPADYGGAESERYLETVREVARQSAAHFGAMEGGDRVFLDPHRPSRPDAYAEFLRLVRPIRQADPNTPLLARLPHAAPPQSDRAVPSEFAALVQGTAPAGEWFDPAGVQANPQGIAGAWLCPGDPPYAPSLHMRSSPADLRALAWLSERYHATGLLMSDVLGWNPAALGRPANAATRAGGEGDAAGGLFYPGGAVGIEGVLPSVRLKRLRRGVQDMSYVQILRRNGRPHEADHIVRAMVRYGGLAAGGERYLDPRLDGWVQDGEAWEQARRLLADEIVLALRGEEATANERFAQEMAWRVFEDKVSGLAIERVRTRMVPLAPTQPHAATRYRTEIVLELCNQRNRDMPLAIRIAQVPPGWSLPLGHTLASLGPRGRTDVTLAAEGGILPPGPDGRLPFTLAMAEPGGEERSLGVEVPFVLAPATDRALRIDGDLADWPVRFGSGVGAFRVVGVRGQRGERARQGTTAMLLRDAANLYIGVRCQSPARSRPTARRDNRVEYRSLLPWGEDLVVVLLDPARAAAGPQDLYHLVIKPNGVLIAERGVRSDPPLGPVRPWAPGAVLAVREEPGGWSAELAIPLAAFGDAGREELWGLNILRAGADPPEVSSWSGAVRSLYPPATLGTLWLPPTQPTTAPAAPPPEIVPPAELLNTWSGQ